MNNLNENKRTESERDNNNSINSGKSTSNNINDLSCIIDKINDFDYFNSKIEKTQISTKIDENYKKLFNLITENKDQVICKEYKSQILRCDIKSIHLFVFFIVNFNN